MHGDDFVVVGMPSELAWMQKNIEEKYELKAEVLGPDKGQCKEVRVLNRILRWTARGIEYEVIPRHVEMIIKQLNLSESKPVITRATKDEGRAKDGDRAAANYDIKLDDRKHAVFRAIVARANVLAPDRPDIAFSVKEPARSMSSPTTGDWERLRRLARYLKGKPRVVKWFDRQRTTGVLNIYTDADWAGDKVSRKSTLGGCIMIGKHLLKGWAETRTLVALSSGESELYATLRAASEGLGVQSVTKGLGINLRGEVWGDASAAQGIIKRRGLGKTRRIDTGFLWIQQIAAENRLKFGKVLGRDTPADFLHKVP